MARRKLVYPTKAVTFRIDERNITKFELLLFDPLAQRSAYGRKSQIVDQLIERLIRAAAAGGNTINVSDLIKLLLSE